MNGFMMLMSLLSDADRLEANRRRASDQLALATAALVASRSPEVVQGRRARRSGGARCPNCGKRASEESRYCQHCGHRPARGFK